MNALSHHDQFFHSQLLVGCILVPVVDTVNRERVGITIVTLLQNLNVGTISSLDKSVGSKAAPLLLAAVSV
jgi:hypothetical protein